MSGGFWREHVSADDLREVLNDVQWLSFAFIWGDSPQGDLFWRKQHEANRLTPEGRAIIEAALAEIEGEPEQHKYNVGDRVESVPVPEAGIGTVIEVLRKDTYRVEYSNSYYGVCTDHAENIRPHESALSDRLREAMAAASKPRRAIVARMQNGKPTPAYSPHVHATTESARKEAERLASANIGAEFAVLEIVSISKATARVTTEAA